MRTLLTFFFTVAAGYGVLVLFVYLYQSRLVYFPQIPSRELERTPAAIGLEFEEMRVSTTDGVSLHGWFVPAQGSLVVLICHGNAGNISHRLELIRILHDLDVSVLIFDYRGYGRSDGRPDESGTYRDAAAALEFLTRAHGYQAKKVILFGESLGGAIAAHVARQTTPAALILVSTFTSVLDLARYHYPYLPVRWLSRFRYETVDYLRNVTAPTLIVHSAEDEIIPISQGRRLFEAAREPKEFLQIFGDHNAGLLMSETVLRQGIRRFIERHVSDELEP